MKLSDFIRQLNNYGSLKEPFFFVINYDMTQYHIQTLKDLDKDIYYQIDKNTTQPKKINITKEHISFDKYLDKFNHLQTNIKDGNTYLANLTSTTKIKTTSSLKEIYNSANAKFKLYFKNQFVSFSPERFIECKNNKIYTYPMKGTIDASIKDAKKKILNNKKELAEHTMVVDLLRNDLSMVSKNVRVEDFRYIQKIEAGDKQLYQVSSKISGNLPTNWHKQIGDIIVKLLPAGSITGTPKINTVKILDKIENYQRGYFTGVFGVFDGKNLDSGVLIRFIENQNGNLIYKSGGGITSDSIATQEYQEMCDKVYIP